MLESCGFHATNGLRVLEQKSLIKVGGGCIRMHDRIVEMGKNIVRRQHPDEPNRHSRLWVQHEIKHVLADNSGSEATRCIELKITSGIFLEGLGNMKKLRCLIVNHKEYKFYDDLVKIDESHLYFPNSLRYLYWRRYPHWCLPKTFEENNLVELAMPASKIEQLWKGGKVMKKLKFLDLSFTKLRSLDLGLTPNLERLHLEWCNGLVKLDVHGGCLKSLVYLNLSYCKRLKSILFIERLESLEVLHMGGLHLSKFPYYIIIGHSDNSLLERRSLLVSICSLQHLRTLNLSFTYIEELPKDLDTLECLETLDLSGIHGKHLPSSIFMLKGLKTLLLRRCDLLEKLPEDVGQLESLEKLDLESCPNLREIPNSICKLKCLKELKFRGCRRLEKLPDELGNLKCLQLLDVQDTAITDLSQSISLLKGLKIYRYKLQDQILDDGFIWLCSKYKKHQIQGFRNLRTLDLGRCGIKEVPEAVGQLECLVELKLNYTDVKQLPDIVCMLKHLKKLILQRCVLLEKLPEDVGHLESLEVLDLSRCYSMRDIPNSTCMLKQLKVLNLYHCFCLERLPEDVGQLESLEELYITRCYNIRVIPRSIRMLKHLKKYIMNTNKAGAKIT